MPYAQQRQPRRALRLVPNKPAPGMGELSWESFGNFATDIYGTYSQTSIAESQSQTSLATAQTELEALKIQRQNAQTQAEIAALDADIRTKQLEIASKFLIVVVPVLLVGGGILWYVTRPKRKSRR